ncbi:MAG TPA: hypothetical protein PKD32_10215 [Saprospiraceae bacterium]|nr:hypothetical protein [Saprospiraceae bacterium]
MKKILLFSVLSAVVFFYSCKEDKDSTVDYEYHAHIHTPNTDNKNLGDTVHLDIAFESHSGQTVHHVNVRIYRKSDNVVLYNKPLDPHVNAVNGTYEWNDTFILLESNGVFADSDLVLEAKVWGENDGDGEEVETVPFHVNP